MTGQNLQKIDHAALRTNQAMVILLSLLAFILDQPVLAALVALVMAAGTLLGMPGFILVYRYIVRPLKLLQPDLLEDHPEPHRFAQSLGAGFLGLGAFATLSGLPLVGWGLVWVVIGLAAMNLFAGFCVGCAIYYWLGRLQVPGFVKSPPPGVMPGKRPDSQQGGVNG